MPVSVNQAPTTTTSRNGIGSKFGRVPTWLITDQRVSGDAIKLFAYYSARDYDGDGRVLVGLVETGKALHWSVSTVQRHRNELKRVGAITAIPRPGTSDVTVLHFDGPGDGATTLVNSATPVKVDQGTPVKVDHRNRQLLQTTTGADSKTLVKVDRGRRLKKLTKHSPAALRSRSDNGALVSSDRGSSVDPTTRLDEVESFYRSYRFPMLADPEARRDEKLAEIQRAREALQYGDAQPYGWLLDEYRDHREMA
jgi:hypothetical protein